MGTEAEENERMIIDFGVDEGEDRFFRFIHPRRRIYLEAIYDKLPECVDELWVFGSAVTYNHYPWSDLDILLVGDNISEYDLNELYGIVRSVGKLDTWNEDKSVQFIRCTKDKFDFWKNEYGHCYYNVYHEGVKYFDRKWNDE